MARIKYDLYLHDLDELIAISSTDGDRFVDVTQESFKNPPIKLAILERDCSDAVVEHFSIDGNDRVTQELYGKKADLLFGRLPAWRLVGVDISPICLSMYYVAVCPDGDEACGDLQYDSAFVYFVANEPTKMEFTVDYADGMPPRRYVLQLEPLDVVHEFDALHVIITEYVGKRKVRSIEFTEGEETEQGQLCHITEY